MSWRKAGNQSQGYKTIFMLKVVPDLFQRREEGYVGWVGGKQVTRPKGYQTIFTLKVVPDLFQRREEGYVG